MLAPHERSRPCLLPPPPFSRRLMPSLLFAALAFGLMSLTTCMRARARVSTAQPSRQSTGSSLLLPPDQVSSQEARRSVGLCFSVSNDEIPMFADDEDLSTLPPSHPTDNDRRGNGCTDFRWHLDTRGNAGTAGARLLGPVKTDVLTNPQVAFPRNVRWPTFYGAGK